MKRKCFLVGLILVIAMFLSGCGSGIVTDEVKVKSVIQEYFLAINDQNWSKAKSCCVYDSEAYYGTQVLEKAINDLYEYSNTVVIACYVTISDVSVNGSYASAYIDLATYIDTNSNYDSESFSGYCYLQKVSNTWKIDSSD